jgi:hypothetical protein
MTYWAALPTELQFELRGFKSRAPISGPRFVRSERGQHHKPRFGGGSGLWTSVSARAAVIGTSTSPVAQAVGGKFVRRSCLWLIGGPTAMLELVRLVLATLVSTIRSRQRLVVENLLLRQQLQVALCSRHDPRLRARDKLLWLLVRRLHRNWRRHLLLIRPETVLGWHRRGWRLFWRWRSCRALGRPRLNSEVRELIATMRRENPHWGTERIRGELLKLGIAVSARSIRRYRRRGPARPPR